MYIAAGKQKKSQCFILHAEALASSSAFGHFISRSLQAPTYRHKSEGSWAMNIIYLSIERKRVSPNEMHLKCPLSSLVGALYLPTNTF